MKHEAVFKMKNAFFEGSIDPVEEHTETETHHIIHNGYREYKISKAEILYFEIREMEPNDPESVEEVKNE